MSQIQENPSILSTAAGVAVGGATFLAVPTATNIITATPLMKNVIQLSADLKADEFKAINKGIEKTLETSGLKAKGVLVRIWDKTIDRYPSLKDGRIKGFLNKISPINQIARGQNAAFVMRNFKLPGDIIINKNEILLPKYGMRLAAFHELGHAANANLSIIGKILQKSRKGLFIVPIIAAISILRSKKPDGVESETKIGKVLDFIKNNAGKLSFLALVPMLLEEGLASLKGNKFAKAVLNPELAQKVAKTNKLAYLTYLGLAISVSLGVMLGVKVRDAIAKPKEKTA